jgi:pimeloyl-ACP methyl ester carboxylesterase
MVEGLRLQIRVVGDPAAGPSVLLINGLGAHTRMWSVLEESFGPGQLIEFDIPGSGRSQPPRRPLTMPLLARLATGVLDHLGVEQADVVGYSMGGVIAQQMAIQSPERVRRLVLVTTSVGVGAVPGGMLPLLNLTTPLRYAVPWFYRHTIGSLAGGRARTDLEWVRAHGQLRLGATPSVRGYYLQVAGLIWTTMGGLRDVQHPTLVIAGGDDPLVPQGNAHLLVSLLPNARGTVLPGEGHLMLADHDSGVHTLVVDFLTAEQHDRSEAWTGGFGAIRGDALRRAMRGTHRQAQPWGLAYAVIRRFYRVG